MLRDLSWRGFKSSLMLILGLMTLLTPTSAQPGRFDIVEFVAPKGWTKEVDENATSFTKVDSSAQTYCAMMLLKSLPAGNDAKKNFQVVWDVIARDYTKTAGSPTMQPTATENGWIVETGAAQATTEQGPAVLMLVAATGGGKTVSLVVVTNSTSFQGEVDAFVGSLKLPKVEVAAQPTKSNSGVDSSLPGLWVRYNTESSGVVNGMTMLSGGYFRREYLLKADGTYRFRAKDWSVYVKDILYVEETGRWLVNGNTLTLTPTQGSGGWWGKAADGRTEGWGARRKSAEYSLEKVSYSFELKYLSGMEETYLYLRSPRPTAREGRQSNQDNAQHEFSYSRRDPSKSLIDTPPGK